MASFKPRNPNSMVGVLGQLKQLNTNDEGVVSELSEQSYLLELKKEFQDDTNEVGQSVAGGSS
jgi:hypothetical protein